ncbi:MAG TPA: hypothetical protein VFA94_16820 [Acidimicrobiales bacterium]|nr:hypothetical protein [Acidimicrobiales bacterium]
MTDAPVATAGVVRATRFELVDADGHVRAVLGDLGSPDPELAVVGFAMVDVDGRQRVWIALDATGPNMVFDLGGNAVLTFGVNDPAPDALHVGAYLHVSNASGTNVLGWRIEDDGSVSMRLGGPTT